MRAYSLAIAIIILGHNLPVAASYTCVAKKVAQGYGIRDFSPIILSVLSKNIINITRKIEIAKNAIDMDEQYTKVKSVACNLPGKYGKKFSAQGFEGSINSYRIDPAIFSKNPPHVVRISSTLDKESNGKHCLPAVYECTRVIL